MSSNSSPRIVIVGAGMVGMSLAWQLLDRNLSADILVIEKEDSPGRHTSGRNSGILHAGIYYPPSSLKAKVCVGGAQRLKKWCADENLPINNCGKLIVPQTSDLDFQLDVLAERGIQNGATVEIIDHKYFSKLCPFGRTSSGRALWSPNTSVVDPLTVIKRLYKRLESKGVIFKFSSKLMRSMPDKRQIVLNNGQIISYDYLFNCAGLYSDQVAHLFGSAEEFTMLPFKGTYYQLKKDCPLSFTTNLYPVPDLNFPFLGVHITPGMNGSVYLGPTAIPAFGRENYQSFSGVDFYTSTQLISIMTRQFISDPKMRRYIFQQSMDWLPSRLIKSVKLLAPMIELNHIELSPKVGIRPQLYSKDKDALVQDFTMLNYPRFTSHIINAISPAFTASFALADYIIDSSNLLKA